MPTASHERNRGERWPLSENLQKIPGADPGFRRGGGFVHSEGGGGVRTGISGADPNCCRALGKSTSQQKLQTAVGGGGGPIAPKKTL